MFSIYLCTRPCDKIQGKLDYSVSNAKGNRFSFWFLTLAVKGPIETIVLKVKGFDMHEAGVSEKTPRKSTEKQKGNPYQKQDTEYMP